MNIDKTNKALVYSVSKLAELEERNALLEYKLSTLDELETKVSELEKQNEELRKELEKTTISEELYRDWWFEAEDKLKEQDESGWWIEQATPESSSDDKIETVSSNTDGE